MHVYINSGSSTTSTLLELYNINDGIASSQNSGTNFNLKSQEVSEDKKEEEPIIEDD